MKDGVICWVALLALAGCARHAPASPRPDSWARELAIPGVENLHRVSPDLYRSEQFEAHGVGGLEKLGIKTVVSLRSFHSDRGLLEGSGLGYERISFETWNPEWDELVRFLKIATDPQKTPVLVHCLHGSDRTGAMSAAYRVVVQGWSKKEAIREMREGGYGHHKIWGNLATWIEELDVEALQAEQR